MKNKFLLIPVALGFALALALLWAVGGGSPAQAAPATELHVCPSGCTYSSIQAAVDAANPGDVIKVAQGTYTGVHHVASLDTATFTATQIVAITKSLTIRGGYTTTNWTTPYPITHPTTLDARGLGRAMVISGTIAPTVVGLYITGGNSKGLGGMYWGDAGGAIYIHQATAVISDNQIYSNTATWYGGGLYLLNSAATVSRNSIFENSTQKRGGGLYVDHSSATLSDNDIYSNTTGSRGGGICSFWSEASLSRNTFRNNTSVWGGGLYLYGQGGTLNSNLFVDNHAAAGGGIYLNYEWGSTPTLVNSALVGNQASEGSGIWFGGDQYSSPNIVRALHTTLYDNRGGAGIFVGQYASLALTNTVIASHTAGITVTAGSTATLNATLWQTNGVNYGGNVSHTNDHSGDPAFESDGYHLRGNSAAIDAGVNAGVTTDIDGDTRPIDAIYDIGADETARRFFVYLPLAVRNY